MPLTRRQVYARRRIAVGAILVLVLGTAFYLPMTLLAPLTATVPVVAKTSVLPGAAATLKLPTYGGSAIGAVGFDGVLAQGGSTKPLPMASITKVVTALVVLEAKPLKVGEEGPSVTMTAADVALYKHYLGIDGSVTAVRAGLTFTEHELLELSLVHSANNYAATMAIWAYGSQDAYVAAATKWVAAHHLDSMTITDPTGIEPTDVASTADLVELGKLALADPVVASIVSTKDVTIHDVGQQTNTNTLLGSHGVDGIKTGTLNGAGANLLFSADYTIGGSPVTVVGVVLGGSTHPQIDGDIATMLDAAKAGFHEVQLTKKGQVLATYSTGWGQQASAIAETTSTALTWSDTPVGATVSAKPVTTGSRGTVVGSVVFTVGDRRLSVPIGLSTSITDPGAGWRLTHPGLIVGQP